MTQQEFPAGEDQSLVVYGAEDTGNEIDPGGIFAAIAHDARTREATGHRIVSVAAVPQRHSGAMIGRAGSGFETNVSIAVVCAAPARIA